jgi:NADH:ubiquinone oxidoreductase subunit E
MPQSPEEAVQAALNPFDHRRANLIPLLQEVQARFCYLPQDVLRRIAAKLQLPLAEVYQVATFYRCFSLVPRGKHVVQVCLGTACHVRGAPRVLDRMLRDLKLAAPGTSEDFQFTVETVRCIGCCGLAPVVRVDANTHPHMTQTKAPAMLRKYRKKDAPVTAEPVTSG